MAGPAGSEDPAVARNTNLPTYCENDKIRGGVMSAQQIRDYPEKSNKIDTEMTKNCKFFVVDNFTV